MTPEAEAVWEEMFDVLADPHLQRVAADVIEYLWEKLYEKQIVSSRVNIHKDRYTGHLIKVPKSF